MASRSVSAGSTPSALALLVSLRAASSLSASRPKSDKSSPNKPHFSISSRALPPSAANSLVSSISLASARGHLSISSRALPPSAASSLISSISLPPPPGNEPTVEAKLPAIDNLTPVGPMSSRRASHSASSGSPASPVGSSRPPLSALSGSPAESASLNKSSRPSASMLSESSAESASSNRSSEPSILDCPADSTRSTSSGASCAIAPKPSSDHPAKEPVSDVKLASRDSRPPSSKRPNGSAGSAPASRMCSSSSAVMASMSACVLLIVFGVRVSSSSSKSFKMPALRISSSSSSVKAPACWACHICAAASTGASPKDCTFARKDV